ncbi:MAG: hypothetical protein WC876_07820 [Candidatus Thermoplasmatota archaeon]|jgi:hypothetical protein
MGSNWRDAAAAAGAFVVALALRLSMLPAAPYGDEAAHYSMARTLGFLDRSVHWLDLEIPFQLYPLTLGRPVFAVLHAPGAAFGFSAFRLLGMVYAALLAPLAYGLARHLGVRRPLSLAVAFAIGVVPSFVVWGARTFPDNAMASLAVAGLWAWVAGRPRLASALLLAACWTKETAIPVVVGLAVYELARGIRSRLSKGLRGWSGWRPRGGEAWLLGTVVVAPLAGIAAYVAVPKLPGWTTGGTLGSAVETLLLSSWLFGPALVAAACVPRARPIVAALAALLAFYAVFIVVRGGGINGWYAILPGALALVASAVALDTGLRSVHWPRPAAGLATAGLCLVLAVGVAGGHGGIATAMHPLDPRSEPGLAPSIRFVAAENGWLTNAIEFQERQAPARVLEMDLAWYWIDYPFAGSAATLFSYTVSYEEGRIPIGTLVEWGESSDLTWLQDWNSTFHQAFKATYADCRVFESGQLNAYYLQTCKGREDSLRANLQARETVVFAA